MADEPMAGLMIDEVAEPVAEVEEEQMAAPVMDMEDDLAALFGKDDDFEDDDFEDFNEEEVWEVNEEWLMAPVTLPLVLAMQPPSVYEFRGPSTATAEGPSFPFPRPVSDAEVAAGVSIGEIGPRIFAIEGQGQQTTARRDEEIARLTQQVQALQAVMQQRDTQI
nr:hypothetical protein [Tanacetum cinerariifolium]